jgi:hypothetical protein
VVEAGLAMLALAVAAIAMVLVAGRGGDDREESPAADEYADLDNRADAHNRATADNSDHSDHSVTGAQRVLVGAE